MGLFLKKNINDCIIGIWEINESIDSLLTKINLDQDDLSIFSTFKNDRRKIEWLSTRVLLKELFGSERKIIYDNNGKPLLKDSSYNINISHTIDFVSIIFSKKKEVGIDIEKRSNKIEKISSKFLSKEEFNDIDEKDRIKKLFIYWGAKETLYKIYSKKNLIFNENIIIRPFELEEEGRLYGTLITESFKEEYVLNYLIFNEEYSLVWCCK